MSCLSSPLLLYYAIGTVHTQESKTKLIVTIQLHLALQPPCGQLTGGDGCGGGLGGVVLKVTPEGGVMGGA